MRAAANARLAGRHGKGGQADATQGLGQDLLSELSNAMRDASICGLGQAAPNPLLSVMKYFPEEVGLAAGRAAPPPEPAEGIVT